MAAHQPQLRGTPLDISNGHTRASTPLEREAPVTSSISELRQGQEKAAAAGQWSYGCAGGASLDTFGEGGTRHLLDQRAAGVNRWAAVTALAVQSVGRWVGAAQWLLGVAGRLVAGWEVVDGRKPQALPAALGLPPLGHLTPLNTYTVTHNKWCVCLTSRRGSRSHSAPCARLHRCSGRGPATASSGEESSV